jgi:ubiquinol-cytochrome c reductase cytochrome b subunit
MRFWYTSLSAFIVKLSALFYFSPTTLSYWWNFGALSFYFLIVQIITGVVLSMFYNPSIFHAYESIMALNNEIYFGWWLRCLHANGASFFFIAVFLHMGRGLYSCSFMYPRQALWISGMVIFVLMIIVAFFGYILPWGQMSFWGGMVITSLLGSIPFIGVEIIQLLWGGFSLHDVTLHRFYSLHFSLSFVMLAIVVLHILFLHEFGSNNPSGVMIIFDKIPFSAFYILKDGLTITLVLILLFIVFVWLPDLLGHPINYVIANFSVTPEHIVPEWYFWFFYAVLRSVPSKLGGLFLLICSLGILFFLPYLSKNFKIRSSKFRPWFRIWFWLFLSVCFLLGWIGDIPVMDPYLDWSRYLTFGYFVWLLFAFPSLGSFEKFLYDTFIWVASLLKLDEKIANLW